MAIKQYVFFSLIALALSDELCIDWHILGHPLLASYPPTRLLTFVYPLPTVHLPSLRCNGDPVPFKLFSSGSEFRLVVPILLFEPPVIVE